MYDAVTCNPNPCIIGRLYHAVKAGSLACMHACMHMYTHASLCRRRTHIILLVTTDAPSPRVIITSSIDVTTKRCRAGPGSRRSNRRKQLLSGTSIKPFAWCHVLSVALLEKRRQDGKRRSAHAGIKPLPLLLGIVLTHDDGGPLRAELVKHEWEAEE